MLPLISLSGCVSLEQQHWKLEPQIRRDKLTSIDTSSITYSPNPIFYHLLESSRWDDSNKLTNIGFGEKIDSLVMKIRILSVTLQDLKQMPFIQDLKPLRLQICMYMYISLMSISDSNYSLHLVGEDEVWSGLFWQPSQGQQARCCVVTETADWVSHGLPARILRPPQAWGKI